jgi:hypothetical protein
MASNLPLMWSPNRVCGLAVLASVALVGCGAPAPAPGSSATTPVYDKETGRLERIDSDRDGDGKVDTRAYMDGVHIKYIEIDRNGDGKPDRWEYYVPAPAGTSGTGSSTGQNMIDHADEANGTGDAITRREFYVNGVISRVEEDTDFDGRTDKWEYYTNGRLSRVDLDLQGRGTPDRRLVYGTNGNLDHMEADPDGDGVFVRMDGAGAGSTAGGRTVPTGRKGGG